MATMAEHKGTTDTAELHRGLQGRGRPARPRRGQDGRGGGARSRPDRVVAPQLGRAGPGGSHEGRTGLTTAEREELTRLRKEVRELRMERDVLKKAAAFFAKDQR